MKDISIKILNLSKVYRLYKDPIDRLKESLHPLRKKYHHQFYALKDINLQIFKNEVVGIIGRNGAGKSTLLKIMTGVTKQTTGTVRTNGKILSLLELGAGFNPELNGLENIYFNGSLFGICKEEMKGKVDSIINFADIGTFIDQPIKSYSSGMVVRLAFAIIANIDADILIIDEALSVGDAFFVQKCMRFLRKFIEDGTLIFVSHDSSAVLNLCSRAIWLSNGQIRADGLPKDISADYLADLYEETQGDCTINIDEEKNKFLCDIIDKDKFQRDMRQDFINNSNLRNDIELFKFNHDAESFGRKGARIEMVRLIDENNNTISWVVGGEIVSIEIICSIFEDIFSPIIGFIVKDRLGQYIFADNTFLTYINKPIDVKTGERLTAKFTFSMPMMPKGEYCVCVAVAEGTQKEHIQHHWIHEALIFKVHSSAVCHGLLGIPMKNIEMEVR